MDARRRTQSKLVIYVIALIIAASTTAYHSASALSVGSASTCLRSSSRCTTNIALSSSSSSSIIQNQFHRRSIIPRNINQFSPSLQKFPSNVDKKCHNQMPGCTALSSTTMLHSHADIAVRLDQPVLSPGHLQIDTKTIWKSVLTLVASDVGKTACVAFIMALFLALITKSSLKVKPKFKSVIQAFSHCTKLVQGQIVKFKDRFQANDDGVPMDFVGDDADSEEEWGICTLASKKQLGRSKFMQYDFNLPKADNVLNLALGQKATLCCLDENDNVAKRDYFLFSPRKKKGQFSIVAAMDGSEDYDVKVKRGEGDFTNVLSSELDIGDEVALQPGPRTLSYKGEYLPVTDMVYIASGSGIAAVLDQVKAVLPSGSSSVKSVSVIWTNEREEDFDVALSSLEDEYFKYSTKLAVSCVVTDDERSLDENEEIDEAVPSFTPGTMAVIAGPKYFTAEAKALLIGYGYPERCICVLP
mmetsp:Transcript_25703/g.29368  ORF Transcript_25703/g.29368 Transcript_25703/m.29368 type:complete len:472 (-) Transcript_25703:1788-3203(-)